MEKLKKKIKLGYEFKKTNDQYQLSLWFRSIYEFNNQGQIKKITFYFKTPRGARLKLYEKSFFDYDANGFLKCVDIYNPKHRLVAKSFYQYDAKGRRIKSVHIRYNFQHKVIGKIECSYKYNNRNLVQEEVVNDGDGQEFYRYTYDEKNRIRKEVYYTKKPNCGYVCIYEYKDGKTIKRYCDRGIGVTSTNKDGEIYKFYGPKGDLTNMLEKKFDKSGNEIYKKLTFFYCDCNGVYTKPQELVITRYIRG